MSLLFFPLKILFRTADLATTLFSFGWVKGFTKLFTRKQLLSVPVNEDESHRVRPENKGNLATSPKDGLSTLYHLQKDSFIRYAERKCMGTREFLGQHAPKIMRFGSVRWKRYEDVNIESHKFGASLRMSGLAPASERCSLDKINTPCSLAIFENTCSEWMVAALGAFSQSIIVTTIYATLGIDAVISAVNDGVICAIVCNKAAVPVLLGKLNKMPTLKTIIYTTNMVSPETDIEMPTVPRGVTVVSFDEFVQTGDTATFPPCPPKPSTCAVIMYTSGSTGKPKGVVITHGQIVSSVASGVTCLGIHEDDTYLGYLPLAHIMELMAEFSMISVGATICYADPKTLTATGAYPIGALEQYSPTMMVGVPKIWDVIKKGVETKIAKSSSVIQWLFNTAFESRTFAISHGFDTPFFNALVFRKFKKVLGGRLRLAVSGGGALNSEVHNFVRTCFGCKFIQAYGLTETCAGVSSQDMDDLRFGVVGAPIPSLEVKVLSTPEICDKSGQPYLSTDTQDVDGRPVFGRGEIIAKGPSISMGYYMLPDKTKEEFCGDGFFRTGDIGQFLSDGSLSIVDRKKNLVKLKGGEYIAIESMEMAYGNSSFVDAMAGGICCYGDGDMDRPVALMQLNKTAAIKWAGQNGIEGRYEDVKESEELMNAVMDDLRNEAKKAGLSHLEKIVAVSFISEPWTPENGCLTAANKLQRRTVINMFEKEFQEVKKRGVF